MTTTITFTIEQANLLDRMLNRARMASLTLNSERLSEEEQEAEAELDIYIYDKFIEAFGDEFDPEQEIVKVGGAQ